MINRYYYYMDEAEEWYDTAMGYPAGDKRRVECMQKFCDLRKLAEKYNTKNYADYWTNLEIVECEGKSLHELLHCTLCEDRYNRYNDLLEEVHQERVELVKKIKDYEQKVEGK